MTGTEFAVATEAAVVWVGAKFMTSEELAEEEKRLGLPGRALYFRGARPWSAICRGWC